MTDTNVSGTVLWESDDEIDEEALAQIAARSNRTDYVERGCGFALSGTTLTVGNQNARGNYAIVEGDRRAFHLFPDQQDLSLVDSDVNHIYIAYDRSDDRAYYHHDTDDSAPTDPSVKIGTADTGSDTTTELNRDPALVARSVSTDDLRTAPTGTLAQLDGNQTFSSGTQSDIAWASETSRGSVSGLVNATDNVVVVPSGYDYATVQLHIRMGSEVPIDVLEVTLNGSPSTYLGTGRLRSNISAEYIGLSSGWFAVSQNDEIGAILQQSSGSSVDLLDQNGTYLGVRLL